MDATTGIKQSCTHAVTSAQWVTRCWLYVGISVVTFDVTLSHFYGRKYHPVVMSRDWLRQSG